MKSGRVQLEASAVISDSTGIVVGREFHPEASYDDILKFLKHQIGCCVADPQKMPREINIKIQRI